MYDIRNNTRKKVNRITKILNSCDKVQNHQKKTRLTSKVKYLYSVKQIRVQLSVDLIKIKHPEYLFRGNL